MSTLGPWFAAAYYGSCAECGDDIEPDDEIRASGDGGYLCKECGEEAEDDEDDAAFRTADRP